MKTYHIDNFRLAYTINYPGEKNEDPVYLNYKKYWEPATDNTFRTNLGKIVMWFPIIAQILGIVLVVAGVSDIIDQKRVNAQTAAILSRGVIGIVAFPFLIPIDLVGTIVKLCLDHYRKKKALLQQA